MNTRLMEWIKVQNRLPENPAPVLVVVRNRIALAEWKTDEQRFGFTTREDAALWLAEEITHWMPLPELPDEELLLP